jgi:hypothetical protein
LSERCGAARGDRRNAARRLKSAYLREKQQSGPPGSEPRSRKIGEKGRSGNARVWRGYCSATKPVQYPSSTVWGRCLETRAAGCNARVLLASIGKTFGSLLRAVAGRGHKVRAYGEGARNRSRASVFAVDRHALGRSLASRPLLDPDLAARRRIDREAAAPQQGHADQGLPRGCYHGHGVLDPMP